MRKLFIKSSLTALSATAVLLALGLTSAQAQSTSGVPAEFPPSSFTGKQYVDSKGCVFVRAGFDGAVNWVPRVSRKRTALCGFSPTFASQPAPEVAPVTEVASTPTPAPVATPPRQTAVATPAPAPTPEARPAPRRVVAAPRVVRPAPTRVVRAPVQPVRTAPVQPRVQTPVQAVPRPAPAQVATSCPGASPLSQRYLNSATHTVRCGPQGTHPTSVAVQGTAYPAGTRLAAPAQTFEPPAGYRPAFTDDRLNPNRGLQTRRGFEQMRLVWTAGVPRRLVNQDTGRDVTGLFPGLRFPFTSYGTQQAYVEQYGTEDWPAPTASGASDTAVVSAKNIKPTATIAKPAPAPSNGHRYVQVGAFSNPTNVKNSVAILRQLGLPVSIGSYKKRGKTYKVVLAGPFSNASKLNAGLAAARRAGFGDAYTRK